MHDPKTSHGAALKHVLRYLKGTPTLGLVFNRAEKTVTEEYSDSSHIIDEDDGRSSTCHVFYLNDCPITWCYHHVKPSLWLQQKLQNKLYDFKNFSKKLHRNQVRRLWYISKISLL